MIAKLNVKGATKCDKRVVINPVDIEKFKISDFVTDNSKKMFASLELNLQFLETNPSDWFKMPSYIESKKVVAQLQIVNDIGELGVAMAQYFNKTITTSENEQQKIFQVVAKHRQDYPNCNKKTLNNKN